METDVMAFTFINGFGVIQAMIIGSILFFIPSKRRIPNILLGLFLLSLALYITEHIILDTGFYRNIPHMFGLSYLFDYSMPALFFVYIQSLATSDFKLTRKHLLHFIPTLLAFICIVPILLSTVPEKIAFYENEPDNMVKYYLIFGVNVVYLLVYIILSFITLNKTIKSGSEKTGYRNYSIIRWLRALTISITVIVILSSIFDSSPALTHLDEYLMPFMLTVVIYGIMIIAICQSEIFTSGSAGFFIPKYQSSTLTEEKAEEIEKNVIALMEEQELFSDSLITIKNVASHLTITPHNLSQVLNERCLLTFPQFVNGYRIRKAQELLRDESNKNRSISEIAYEVGFNSLSSFNMYFKTIANTSPSKYRKST